MDSSLLLSLFSIALVLVGAKLLQKGNHLTNYGKKAKAIVFKNSFEYTGGKSGAYYPVVRFTTENQEWITQKLDIGYSSPKPEGMRLEIIYDPDNPKIVGINTAFQLKILPLLCLVIGFAGFLWGIFDYLGFF